MLMFLLVFTDRPFEWHARTPMNYSSQEELVSVLLVRRRSTELTSPLMIADLIVNDDLSARVISLGMWAGALLACLASQSLLLTDAYLDHLANRMDSDRESAKFFAILVSVVIFIVSLQF